MFGRASWSGSTGMEDVWGFCPRSGDKQVPSQSACANPTGGSEAPCDSEGAEAVVASVLGREVGRLRCKIGPIQCFSQRQPPRVHVITCDVQPSYQFRHATGIKKSSKLTSVPKWRRNIPAHPMSSHTANEGQLQHETGKSNSPSRFRLSNACKLPSFAVNSNSSLSVSTVCSKASCWIVHRRRHVHCHCCSPLVTRHRSNTSVDMVCDRRPRLLLQSTSILISRGLLPWFTFNETGKLAESLAAAESLT